MVYLRTLNKIDKMTSGLTTEVTTKLRYICSNNRHLSINHKVTQTVTSIVTHTRARAHTHTHTHTHVVFRVYTPHSMLSFFRRFERMCYLHLQVDSGIYLNQI